MKQTACFPSNRASPATAQKYGNLKACSAMIDKAVSSSAALLSTDVP